MGRKVERMFYEGFLEISAPNINNNKIDPGFLFPHHISQIFGANATVLEGGGWVLGMPW